MTMIARFSRAGTDDLTFEHDVFEWFDTLTVIPKPQMKYVVIREVVETLEVEAADDYEADEIANETPIDEWTRNIKSWGVVKDDNA